MVSLMLNSLHCLTVQLLTLIKMTTGHLHSVMNLRRLYRSFVSDSHMYTCLVALLIHKYVNDDQ